MLETVAETATWTTDKITAIRTLCDHTADFVRARLPKIYTRELIDLLFEQPYCRIANLEQKGLAKRQTASRYLKLLVEIGALEERQVGRAKLFVHPKLMELLKQEGNDFDRYS